MRKELDLSEYSFIANVNLLADAISSIEIVLGEIDKLVILASNIEDINKTAENIENIENINEALESDFERYNLQNTHLINISEALVSNLNDIDRVVSDVKEIELNIETENSVFKELLPAKDKIVFLANNMQKIEQALLNIERIDEKNKEIKACNDGVAMLRYEQMCSGLKIDLNYAKTLARFKTL